MLNISKYKLMFDEIYCHHQFIALTWVACRPRTLCSFHFGPNFDISYQRNYQVFITYIVTLMDTNSAVCQLKILLQR